MYALGLEKKNMRSCPLVEGGRLRQQRKNSGLVQSSRQG